MDTVHITEAELANDARSILQRVVNGAEVIVEIDSQPVVVMRAAHGEATIVGVRHNRSLRACERIGVIGAAARDRVPEGRCRNQPRAWPWVRGKQLSDFISYVCAVTPT